MTSDKVNSTYETLMGHTLFEICELINIFEEKHGNIMISAPAAAAPAAGGAAPAAASAEKSSMNVVLKNPGTDKVALIKIVKEITGLGLMDAKKLVDTENAVIKEGANKDEAEGIKKKLEEAGGTVELQ